MKNTIQETAKKQYMMNRITVNDVEYLRKRHVQIFREFGKGSKKHLEIKNELQKMEKRLHAQSEMCSKCKAKDATCQKVVANMQGTSMMFSFSENRCDDCRHLS